jgi:hypothetical protein
VLPVFASWLSFALLTSPPPVLIQGEVEHEAVEAVVKGKQKELRFCYEQRQSDAPVSLRVRFEIDAFGRVFSVSSLGAEPGVSAPADAHVEICVLNVFSTLVFSPPEHGTVVVNYPVHFYLPSSAPVRSARLDRLTSQSIKDVLADGKASFAACYEKTVKERPTLRGSPVTVAFNVGNDGSPIALEVRSEHGVSEIDACLRHATSALRFARPREGERARVQLPLVLW